MSKTLAFVLALLMVSFVFAQAPAPADVVSVADAESDVRYLDDLLQRVHADPYTAFGGRVAYAKRVDELVAYARASPSHTRAQLRRALATFLSELGDGHTYLDRLPQQVPGRGVLPLRFAAASDELFISDARAAHQALLGARVVSINGLSVAQLEREVRLVFPMENASGARNMLSRMVGSEAGMQDLVPGSPARVALQLSLASGEKRSVSLAFDPRETAQAANDWVAPAASLNKVLPPGPFAAAVLADREVGYLQIRSMVSREAFEQMKTWGRTDIGRWLDQVYQATGTTRPTSIDEAIAGAPSLIEGTHTLLGDMRRHAVKRLIVDIRGNNGGWSPMIPPFLFQLFGERYLANPDPTRYATRISVEGLALNGGTLEALSASAGRTLRPGDYLFNGGTDSRQTRDDFRARLSKQGMSRTDLLATPGIRDLDVTVVTDGGTFSAAFDLTCELARFGARLVGESPGQAPSGFVDGTPFELPRTHLRGGLSRTAVTHPGVESDAGSMRVAFPMTWGRYRQYGFRGLAPVEYAIDVATGRDKS